MTVLAGQLKTILDETTIAAGSDGSTAGGQVIVPSMYERAVVLLTVSDKTMDSSTTLNIYLQYSPDEGTTWDDLVSFAQVTNSAIADGTYVAVLNGVPATSTAARVTTDGSLAAGSVNALPWCDRLRVKYTKVNFAGTDTITIKVQAYFVP